MNQRCKAMLQAMTVFGLLGLGGCALLGGGGDEAPVAVGDAPRPAFADPELMDQSRGAGAGDPSAYTIDADQVLTVDDQGRCEPLVLTTGERLSLLLPGNPSTGYLWQLDDRPEGLRLLSAPRADEASDSDAVGAPLVYDWRFEAMRAGQGSLRLIYHRPWEEQAEPAGLFICPIEIRAN
ncbi:protease inhibitor I42 family protein [Halotalea alkalilenta]|nr:protease inhibitor I42 family protein [Halotalea alkalilenta]